MASEHTRSAISEANSLAIDASFRQGWPASLQAGGMPDQLPRRLDLRRHVGEAEVHRLVLDDGLAEGLALLRIAHRRLERRARHADRLRGDADAPGFEIGERDAVAVAFVAEQAVGRDAAVLEQDLRGVGSMLAQLFLDAGDDVARRVGRHAEAGNALLAGGRIGDREDDGDLRVLARGDELLDAIQHPTVAVLDRARVVIAAASEPVCGSVRQKQPSSSPEAAPLSQRCLLRVVAVLRSRMPQTSEFCTDRMVEVAPSPAAISSSATASDR